MQGRHQENVGGRNANPTNLQEQITNNVLKHTTANLPSTNSPAEGPNLGFKPTAAMSLRHEDTLVSGKRPLYQFQITKLRTWRTGYTRLLCLYKDHFSTYDLDGQVTNVWKYGLLTDFMTVEKDQFLLQVQSDKLKFKCHNVDRSLVLSALLQCKDEFENSSSTGSVGPSAPPMSIAVVLCNRWTRHGQVVPSALRLTAYALVEVNPTSKLTIKAYRFVDIISISFLSDDSTGIILHLKTGKKRLFCVTNKSRSDLVMWMRQAKDRIGLELHMTDSYTLQEWKDRRQQEQRPRKLASIATEYQVTKQSKRHDANVVGSTSGWPGGTINRRLCITGTGVLLEKDTSGAIVSILPLSELYAIVRPPDAGDTIWLEHSDGHSKKYTSKKRDSLIVSILDSAATLGKNPKVHVSDVPSGGYCLASFSAMANPEKSGGVFQPISIPLHCLKRVHTVGTAAFSYMNCNTESSTEEGVPINPIEECRNVIEICREFNASVLPTAHGLPTSEKDKQVLGSIGSLWGLVAWLLEYKKDTHLTEQYAGPILQTLHRLSKTAAGYKSSIELATFLDCIPLLVTIDDAFCKFWAFRTLTVLLSGLPGKLRDKEIEYVNKSVIFSAGPRLIHEIVQSMLDEDSSDLIRMVMSDILQSVLCSYADTTTQDVFASFMKALGEDYPALLNTLHQQTPFVLENSTLLLHLLNTNAPKVAVAIREASLASGILLHHFHAAIFSPLTGHRFLSRFLCSLWLSGPVDCNEKKLLERMVPKGFIPYLQMPLLSRAEEEQLDIIEQDIPEDGRHIINNDDITGAAGTNTARLRSRIFLTRASLKHGASDPAPENFRIFFHTLSLDQSLPDLIWNQQTRRELRIGLESEIQYINRETETRGRDKIAWNHQQFTIEYPSLDSELRVGSVYMRLWLQAGKGFIQSFDEPLRLFELLFRRLLCELDRNTNVTVMCIRCLERLYAVHGTEIGAFPDVMIIVRSMGLTNNVETQHRLLGLLAAILGVRLQNGEDERLVNVPENAEQLLNVESIEQLCQFVAWCHIDGVQNENLMTSILVSTQQKKLLTAGSQTQPDGYAKVPSRKSSASSLNAACPPVWFVATTHKKPPPSEFVQGPFQINKLKEMLTAGEISQFTLVTSTHVTNYEQYDGVNTAELMQIDTGKWRRLDEVWQLRWQLCTDGNETGIYSSSEVALRALLSLTRLVDLHRSLDSRGRPYYPIPIAKRIICGMNKDLFSSSSGETLDNRLSFLSVLAQSILCHNHDVVDQAANLLYKLTQYNEQAMSKIYLTGLYFFITCYTGSNFLSLAKLMHATHLEQCFRSGYAAAADNDELVTKDRSVLGGLLPKGLLHILINYGVERFNDAFVGYSDNPEVIWNLDMRKHLIEMVRQHLGDFPKRLWQNTTTQYEYCPMPSVAYKRLEKEIFCHNYYLRNLCDEDRFPNWPISDPPEVFRSCLEEFKKQMNRNGNKEEEALQGAVKILNLQPGDRGPDLRKSYRSLARKYHPDKNPAGREMFLKLQTSYELLLPIIDNDEEMNIFEAHGSGNDSDNSKVNVNSAEGFPGGLSQMETLQLLIKTQILICKRFERDIGKYKYPVYQLLLGTIKLTSSCREFREKDDHGDNIFFSSFCTKRRALFVKDAVELVFRTCLVSPMNAEELVSESGIAILYSIFDFYLYVGKIIENGVKADTNIVTTEVLHDILTIVLHTIAGVAYYETGRRAIESLDISEFCLNWRRCIDGKLLSKSKKVNGSLLTKFAVEGIVNMAKSEVLQNTLVGAGIIWPLGRFLLGFDPTLDESTIPHDSTDDDVNVSQASCNTLARLSVRALGMLSGLLIDPQLVSPRNIRVQTAMNKILTSPIALLLRNKHTSEILRTLNSNFESPAKIWNVEMRGELMNLLSTMENNRREDKVQSLDEELDGLSGFEFGALKNELQIGGIYVRIFNKVGLDKGILRDVTDPSAFAKKLIRHIARCINAWDNVPDNWIVLDVAEENAEMDITSDTVLHNLSISDSRFVMVVSALRLLIRAESPIDNAIYIPSVVFSLLELPPDSEAFEIGCNILSILTSKQGFIDAVAEQGALWRLLWILKRPSGLDDSSFDSQDQNDMLKKQIGWDFLESLSSSSSVALKILESSVWLELFGILVGYSEFTKVWKARVGAAKILSRLLWDPQTGEILAPLLGRFLPTSLIIVLKEEGPDSMLLLFDGESDTPELIWDATMRGQLRKIVATELDLCMQRQHDRGVGNNSFNLEINVRVKYAKLENELFVGGVYVTRFLKDPTSNIRDPASFLEMLLQRWTNELQIQISNESNEVEKYSTDVVVGGQDNLENVTDAIVFLLKIRKNLCDTLTKWGYMSQCLSFLQDILRRELLGSPLLSVMRILHVAVNRRINVESLVASGTNDSLHGIIPFTMRAVGNVILHVDAGFMLEMLKKVFLDALGNLQNMASFHRPTSNYAMAPSPAPGENPVSRRVRVNASDDPLGFGAGLAPTPVSVPSQEGIPHMNTSINYGYEGQQPVNVYNRTGRLANINHTSNAQNYLVRQQQSHQAHGSAFGDHNQAVQQFQPTTSSISSTSNQNFNVGQNPLTDSYTQRNVMAQQAYSPHAHHHHQQQQRNISIQQHDRHTVSPSAIGHSFSSEISSSVSQTNTCSLQNNTNQIKHQSIGQYSVQNQGMSQGLNTPTFQKPKPQGPTQIAPEGMTRENMSSCQNPSLLPQNPQVNYQPIPFARQQHKHDQIIANNTVEQIDLSHNFQRPEQSPIKSTPVVETVTNCDQTIDQKPYNAYAQIPHSQYQSQEGQQNCVANRIVDARTQPELSIMQAVKQTETIEGAPGCARGRRNLLESALICDLANYLIKSVLENPSLSKVKDPASVIVHTVEILKLLVKDPGYGLKFQLILDKIPQWKKYVSQDHSLFITGIEQKTDYFLTDGNSSKDLNKFLTQG